MCVKGSRKVFKASSVSSQVTSLAAIDSVNGFVEITKLDSLNNDLVNAWDSEPYSFQPAFQRPNLASSFHGEARTWISSRF